MNPFLKTIVTRILGTAVRHGVTVLGAWLEAKGAGALDANTQTNLTQEIIGGICILIGFGWSYYRTHNASNKIQDLEKFSSAFSTLQKLDQEVQGSSPKQPLPSIMVMIFSSFFAASMIGCAVMSNFDQNTYNAAIELKSESLNLISNATEEETAFHSQIEALKAKLSAQVAYEQGKGKKNLISAQQWKILISEDHDLLGKLLKDWENGKKFSHTYVVEKSHQVSDGFDEILKLEGAKNK